MAECIKVSEYNPKTHKILAGPSPSGCTECPPASGSFVFLALQDNNWENINNWMVDGVLVTSLPGLQDSVIIGEDVTASSPVSVSRITTYSSVNADVSCGSALFLGTSVLASGRTLSGDSVWMDYSENLGNVYGRSYFSGDSKNLGSLFGEVKFYENAHNAGSISGKSTLYDSSTALYGLTNYTLSGGSILGHSAEEAAVIQYAATGLSMEGDYESTISLPNPPQTLRAQDDDEQSFLDYLSYFRRLNETVLATVANCQDPKVPAVVLNGILQGEIPSLSVDCICGFAIPTGINLALKHLIQRGFLRRVRKYLYKKRKELIKEITDLPLGLPDEDILDIRKLEQLCRKRGMLDSQIETITRKIKKVQDDLDLIGRSLLRGGGILDEIDVILAFISIVWPKVCVGGNCGTPAMLDEFTCECNICQSGSVLCPAQPNPEDPRVHISYNSCEDPDVCECGSVLNTTSTSMLSPTQCYCECPKGTIFRACSAGCNISNCYTGVFTSKGVCVPPSNCEWDETYCRWNCSSSSSTKCGCNSVYVESIFPGDFLDTCQCRNGFIFRECDSPCLIYSGGGNSRAVCVPDSDCAWNKQTCSYDCPSSSSSSSSACDVNSCSNLQYMNQETCVCECNEPELNDCNPPKKIQMPDDCSCVDSPCHPNPCPEGYCCETNILLQIICVPCTPTTTTEPTTTTTEPTTTTTEPTTTPCPQLIKSACYDGPNPKCPSNDWNLDYNPSGPSACVCASCDCPDYDPHTCEFI